MAAPLFRPPGDLTDFDGIPHQREAWDATMTTFFLQAIQRAEQEVGAGKAQIFDAVHALPQPSLTEATIIWNGFPKTLLDGNTHEQALQLAEQLLSFRLGGRTVQARPQDEYLEWHATRDTSGRITAVDFTCEGPEYWTALAHGYPDSVQPGAGAPPAKGDLDAVVELYRKFVSPSVQKQDLLHNGSYDPYNAWNTQQGAMHLTHPSNSLQAEVFLAGDASVLREKNGQLIEDDDELIRCAQYGVPTRSSDPTIGGSVNGLARTGALVSLAEPVGLYIDSLDTTGWTRPDGSPVGDYWTILRGSPTAVVRARYEVPASEGFAVGDIQIGGEPIALPGQVAEAISMKLTGVAGEQGQHAAPPVPCVSGVQPLVAPAIISGAPVEMLFQHSRAHRHEVVV